VVFDVLTYSSQQFFFSSKKQFMDEGINSRDVISPIDNNKKQP